MRSNRNRLAACAAVAALLVSPTAAMASTVSSAQPASNSWVTLSQMTAPGAAALAGSAVAPSAATMATSAAAVQPMDDAAPRANPLPIPVIVVLLAVLGTAIYIALIEKHHGHATFPGGAVSPS